MTHETRESWLLDASHKLPEELAKSGLVFPSSIPHDLTVSCGFPSKGALSAKTRRLGECWHGGEESPQVYVSPTLDKPIDVLDTLAHELLHSMLPPKTGHKGPFKRAMVAVGLEGKPTSTHAGEKLTGCLNNLAEMLGPYPHKAIDAGEGRKKQTTRLRLYACGGCEEPVKVRVARDAFDATCNLCGVVFDKA